MVKKALDEINVSLPVFGMVKDSYHKTRALTDGECEISIARDQAVFQLIYGIQEEVHRYTVSRMTNAKRKTLKTSSLTRIPGIGPAKAKALLGALGGIAGVKSADEKTLESIPGISSKDAENIISYFKQ